jgi:hypothetical protein
MTMMIEVDFETFHANFDDYMEKIERDGQTFLVRLEDGRAVVAAPADLIEPEND